MKKLLILLLTFMLILSTASCDSKKTNDDDDDENEASSTEENSNESPLDSLLVSNEYVDIKYLGIEKKENGFKIKFSVTSKYNDQRTLHVYSDYGAINGMMVTDPSCSSGDIAFNETKEMTWHISQKPWNDKSITIENLIDAKVRFHVSNSAHSTLIDTDTVSLDFGSDAVQEFDKSGDVLYDQNGVKIYSQGSYVYGYAKLLIENNSENDIKFKFSDEIINGFSVYTIDDIVRIFSDSVLVVPFSPTTYSEEKYDIKSVNSISFKAEVTDFDGNLLFNIDTVEATYDTIIDPIAD